MSEAEKAFAELIIRMAERVAMLPTSPLIDGRSALKMFAEQLRETFELDAKQPDEKAVQ